MTKSLVVAMAGLCLTGCMFFHDPTYYRYGNGTVVINGNVYIDGRTYRDERGTRYTFHLTGTGGYFEDDAGQRFDNPPKDLTPTGDRQPNVPSSPGSPTAPESPQ